jgi:hypothetical protein
MSTRPLPLWSVLVMESRLRFRRSSTWVLFVLLCVAAFYLMPETGSGGTAFLIAERRVLLNSAATSLTSSILGGLILSLAAFYVISDSLGTDLRTGMGHLIASSPLSSARYLAGKLLGNIVFLYLLCFVFMLACMAVHLLHGEAALEPLVFFRTFGVEFIPMVPCIAGIALVFECVRFLSGRGGDVLYFLFWLLFISIGVLILENAQSLAWLLAVDISGMGFFLKEIVHITGTTHFTIGYSPYDASLTPVLFQGLDWDPAFVLPRLLSTLFVLPLFAIALAFFRRFDPARQISKRAEAGFISRIGHKLSFQWLQGFVSRIPVPSGAPSLARAAALEMNFTFALFPVLLLMLAATAICGLFCAIDAIRIGIVPAVFFVTVPMLAGIPTRDRVDGTTPLIFTAPLVRRNFVFVKLIAALGIMLLLSAIPLIRITLDAPMNGLALLVGLVFASAAATALGLLTGSPKPFVVTFLLFLYLAISTKTEPAFDFAGWEQLTTLPIIAAYAIASFAMVSAAWLAERWKRMREQ